MSLHDVDKNSTDRSNPTPNSDDNIADGQRMAHQTASSHYKPISSISTARLQQVGKTFIANDGGTNKAIFGFNPALNLWGSFVAKDGIDVMKNTDPSQLIFNSNQDVFKIVKSLSVGFPGVTATVGVGSTVNVTAASAIIIPHGLGYIPAFIAYLNSALTYAPIPFIITGQNGANSVFQVNINLETDIINMYISTSVTVWGPAGSTYTQSDFTNTPIIKIFLLQESIT